ncbi:MAG: hypothetical protein M3Q56_09665 [Bacteroidota bacterium]|nr:hypothetical protein [Bacteroidota bacterium]
MEFIPEGRINIFEADACISGRDGKFLYVTNDYDVEDANYKRVSGATNLGSCIGMH